MKSLTNSELPEVKKHFFSKFSVAEYSLSLSPFSSLYNKLSKFSSSSSGGLAVSNLGFIFSMELLTTYSSSSMISTTVFFLSDHGHPR